MDEHRVERDLLHMLAAGEDHARDPEEDDVVACDEHVRRVEVVQILRLVRPTERGERPERAGEPGVEHVALAADVLGVARLALAGVGAGDGHMAAVAAVPHGDLMAPPELAGDAPVAHAVHPVEIRFGEAVRHELDLAVFHNADGFLRQRLHLHEPLVARKRLHIVMAAGARADIVDARLDGHEIALLLELLHDGLAGLVAVHAVPLVAAGDLAVAVEHQVLRQIVAQADLKVVGVVAGRDLHAAGAELHIGVLIADDGDLAPDERERERFADHVLIARVLGVHRNGGVAEHRLGTGRGDLHAAGTVRQRIADMPEEAVLLHVFDLNVGKGGLAVRTPVDDTLAAVDISLFVQAAERLAHGLGALLVHREALALPVARRAERFELLHDAVAVVLLPVPHTVQELFAAEIEARETLLAELGLHLGLRGDAGVVNARQPQRAVPAHALPADEHVLDRLIERVTQMELAGDVRGRDHDGERLLVRVTLSVEPAAVRPVAVDLAFHLLGIINLRQFFHSYSSKQKRPGDNLRGVKTYAVPPDFRFTESGTRILCNGRTRPFLLCSKRLLRGDLRLRLPKGLHQPPSLCVPPGAYSSPSALFTKSIYRYLFYLSSLTPCGSACAQGRCGRPRAAF